MIYSQANNSDELNKVLGKQPIWTEHSLEDLCDLVNGRGFKPHEWRKTGLPIIRIQNLNGSKKFNYFDGDFNEKILVEPEQLLFAWSGSRGTSFGPHIWTGPRGVLNYHTWKVVPKTKVDLSFLFQLLAFETVRIEESSHGAAALVHVKKCEMEKRKFLVPPLQEQSSIAQLLNTWDLSIEKLGMTFNMKKKRRNGILQSLFNTDQKVGNEWKQTQLSKISNRIRRTSDGNIHPVMTISAKSGFRLQSDKFARNMAGRSVDRYTMLLEGEFAFNKGNSKTAPYGCIYRLDRPSALIPFVYYCFKMSDDLHHPFYEHLFAAGVLNHQLSRLINSGVRNDGLFNLYADDFFGCRIPVPPFEDQVKIARAITALNDELALIEAEVTALKRQKRGLMQKLLTGKLRVGVEDIMEVSE